jgi:hypothetical protein
LVSTAVTFCSTLAGVTVTPALDSSVADAAPHGTSGAHSTTVTLSSPRSARSSTPPGLPAGTAMTRVFVANSSGSPARPSSVTFAMFASSAEANTSTGAPSLICVASVLDPS